MVGRPERSGEAYPALVAIAVAVAIGFVLTGVMMRSEIEVVERLHLVPDVEALEDPGESNTADPVSERHHRPRSQTGRSTFTFHCTPSVPVPSWPVVSRTILFLPISSLAISDFGACQTLELA